MVCIKSLNPPLKPNKVKVWKRDIRESSLRPFGRWITSFDWSDIFNMQMDVKLNMENLMTYNE